MAATPRLNSLVVDKEWTDQWLILPGSDTVGWMARPQTPVPEGSLLDWWRNETEENPGLPLIGILV